jgi:oxygen-independent coproporphyrinogen-3 oxidase
LEASTVNAKPGSSRPAPARGNDAGDPGAAASAGDLGVYIHVPWCRQLCPYCDFAVAVVGRTPIPHRRYLDAILAELAERAPEVAGRRLVSIYFGGGTPSLWEPACLEAAVAAVARRFSAGRRELADLPDLPDLSDVEITLEANPQDCVPERLAAWRAAGIDRLSIGVQSLAPGVLRALGRTGLGDGPAALAAAAAAGFERISADVIFGVPGGAPAGASPDLASGVASGLASGAAGAPTEADEAVRSVAALADTGVGHLSVYELTIEERTGFGKAVRAGRLTPLDEDRLAALYQAVHRTLEARGFEHYEISSYARPGQRAVHNSLYWNGGEYLGLGSSAASFVLRPDGAGVRSVNQRSVHAYLRSRGGERVAEREVLDPAEVARDRVWLGMRTADGVAAEALAGAPALVRWLLDEDLATVGGGRIRPTQRGFAYADRIASRVFAHGVTLGQPVIDASVSR